MKSTKKIQNAMSNKMSLINLDANYGLSVFSDFIRGEMIWLYKGSLPKEVLFIPFAYNGTLYNSYIQDVKNLFGQWGVSVRLINNDEAPMLIDNASGIVMGGGDLTKFLTGVIGYMNLLKKVLVSGKPCLAWNEGGVAVSPAYVVPSVIPISSKCIGATKYQVYTHYLDSPANRLEIKNFLINHKNDVPPIQEVVCLVDSPGGSGIRLEDDNVGLVYGQTNPTNLTQRYTLGNIDQLMIH
jgi:peptidase E